MDDIKDFGQLTLSFFHYIFFSVVWYWYKNDGLSSPKLDTSLSDTIRLVLFRLAYNWSGSWRLDWTSASIKNGR